MLKYKRYAESYHENHNQKHNHASSHEPAHASSHDPAHASSHPKRHFNDVTAIAKHETVIAPHYDAPVHKNYAVHENKPIVKHAPINIRIQYKANLEFKIHVKQDERPEIANNQLPKEYDLRNLYPTINRAYDQGECGSCWALAVLSAIEDKCIIKGHSMNVNQDVMRCFKQTPCEGGNAGEFLNWLTNHDAVDKKCRLSPWCCCVNLSKLNFVRVKKETISVTTKVNNIKKDILQYGSVVAGILVYDNFKHGHFGPHNIYLDTVQGYTTNNRPIFAPLHTLMGGHSVVIIGWGQEKHVETAPNVFETVDYWLCRNSWGTHWGDKGHFKIAHGNHNKTVQLENFYHYKNGNWGGVLTFDVDHVKSHYPNFVSVFAAVTSVIFIMIIFFKLKFKRARTL